MDVKNAPKNKLLERFYENMIKNTVEIYLLSSQGLSVQMRQPDLNRIAFQAPQRAS